VPRAPAPPPTDGSTLLVLTPRRQAGQAVPFAALGLELTGRHARWSGGTGRLVLLDGIDARVTVARSRVGRTGTALVVREATGA